MTLTLMTILSIILAVEFLERFPMKRIVFILLTALTVFVMTSLCFGERDWECWLQESISVPLDKGIDLLVLPEWRSKNDMRDNYLFKLETGPSFKVNKTFTVTPYYVYQEKKSGGNVNKSDLAYLDAAVKCQLKDFFDTVLSSRLRYQYDFDKGSVIWRDSIKLSKDVNVGNLTIVPYISEEPFYDAKLEKLNEHRTTSGITYSMSKNVTIGLGYMLNSKKPSKKWTYTNVLVSNINIKF